MKKTAFAVFVLLIVFSHFIFAVEPFKPVENVIFIGEQCSFTTVIPEVPPNQVQITVQSLPENVSFISSRKQEVLLDGIKSTALFVVLKFSKKGSYKISPVAARIQYGSRYISFVPITVYDDPKNTRPRLYIEFEQEDGSRIQSFSAGSPVRAVLYGMYFSSVLSVTSAASEKGVLLQKKLLHEFPLTRKTFTTEPIALAVYEFTPFTDGEYIIDTITADIAAWAGNHTSINMEAKTIKVMPKAAESTMSFLNSLTASGDSSVFSHAFDPVLETKTEPLSLQEGSDELLAKYLQRRKVLSAVSSGFLVMCIICGVLWFIMYAVKKKKKLYGVLSVVFFMAAVLLSLLLIPRYGVFSGGSVFTIPEIESKTSFSMVSPSLVRIHLDTGTWTYISFPSTQKQTAPKSGWVQTSSLRLITGKEE